MSPWCGAGHAADVHRRGRDTRLTLGYAPEPALEAHRTQKEPFANRRRAVGADMLRQDDVPRPNGVRLGIQVVRRRLFMLAPVVERLGNVLDAARGGRGHDAKEKIPVLCSVRLAAESAQLPDEGGTQRHQVAKVVEGAQLVLVEVGLEGGLAPEAELIDLVFVGVHEVGSRVGIETPGDLEKREWMQFVVVIEKDHEIASGGLDCGVGGRAIPAFLPQNVSRILGSEEAR